MVIQGHLLVCTLPCIAGSSSLWASTVGPLDEGFEHTSNQDVKRNYVVSNIFESGEEPEAFKELALEACNQKVYNFFFLDFWRCCAGCGNPSRLWKGKVVSAQLVALTGTNWDKL